MIISKQIIQEKLENLTEAELDQVYGLIQQLSSSENVVKKPSLMSKLQKYLLMFHNISLSNLLLVLGEM